MMMIKSKRQPRAKNTDQPCFGPHALRAPGWLPGGCPGQQEGRRRALGSCDLGGPQQAGLDLQKLILPPSLSLPLSSTCSYLDTSIYFSLSLSIYRSLDVFLVRVLRVTVESSGTDGQAHISNAFSCVPGGVCRRGRGVSGRSPRFGCADIVVASSCISHLFKLRLLTGLYLMGAGLCLGRSHMLSFL